MTLHSCGPWRPISQIAAPFWATTPSLTSLLNKWRALGSSSRLQSCRVLLPRWRTSNQINPASPYCDTPAVILPSDSAFPTDGAAAVSVISRGSEEMERIATIVEPKKSWKVVGAMKYPSTPRMSTKPSPGHRGLKFSLPANCTFMIQAHLTSGLRLAGILGRRPIQGTLRTHLLTGAGIPTSTRCRWPPGRTTSLQDCEDSRRPAHTL